MMDAHHPLSPPVRPATPARGALRRRLLARGCVLALLAAVPAMLAAVPAMQAQADDARPWLDTTRSFEDRAAALVAQMTLEEKAAQMQNDSPAIERLGLPAYDWWNEALHGVARAGGATVFPQAIGMAASFDIPLMDQVSAAISDEARAKHHRFLAEGKHGRYQGLTFWSPNINIFRDPRWGRGQETYGEDPYLTSRMGISFVRGLQGMDPVTGAPLDPKYRKLDATAKHFAVHSGPEADRHTFDVHPSKQDLYDTYLPAFEALVKEGGVYAVMGAYNRVYGESASASQFLLLDTLRRAHHAEVFRTLARDVDGRLTVEQVAALAVFGNPSAKVGLPLTVSPVWGPRSIDLCNPGDPVCTSGEDVAAHRAYDGGPADQAASFVAGLL